MLLSLTFYINTLKWVFGRFNAHLSYGSPHKKFQWNPPQAFKKRHILSFICYKVCVELKLQSFRSSGYPKLKFLAKKCNQ